MGTREGETPPSASVTMDELKEFKDSLTSSMTTEMCELREMIAQLMQAQKAASPPPPEDPNAADAAAKEAADAKAKAASEAEAKAAEDNREGDKPNTSNSNTDGNPDYKEVPHWYSPNPPVPHPHINNRGDPPKLSEHTFIHWQFLMRSHVQSSCIELWSIIENGLRVENPSNMTRREVVDSQLDATAKHMI